MAILWMLVGMVLLVLIDTLVRTVFSHFRHIGSELTVEDFFLRPAGTTSRYAYDHKGRSI